MMSKNKSKIIGMSEEEAKIWNYASMIQKGDLKLLNVIDNGIIFYGKTKTGKTSLAHMLVGNTVEGIHYNGNHVLRSTSTRNKTAIIGNETASETQIPNFFETKLKAQNGTPITVIDKPGHGDSRGILKIISNGYFHYRVYEKTKNMKFVICFERAHLSGTLQQAVTNIRNFIASFKNYETQKQNIWKSCAFIVTKCPSPKKETEADHVQNIKVIFENFFKTAELPDLSATEVDSMKGFVRKMIDEDRIFAVKHYQKGQKPDLTNMLARINTKVDSWWSRDMKNDRSVNMDPIQFSLGTSLLSSIVNNENLKKQLKQLIEFYNQRIVDYIKVRNDQPSLSSLIDFYIRDCMGKPDDHQFISDMRKLVEENYIKLANDKEFLLTRENVQKSIFQSTDSTTGVSSSSQIKPFFVKKFEVLEKIEQMKTHFANMQLPPVKDLKTNLECQKILQDIFRQLNKVRYARQNSKEVIYKYGYLIDRLFQEQMILFLLIQGERCTDKDQQERRQQTKKQLLSLLNNVGLFDLPRILKDCFSKDLMYQGQDATLKCLKYKYLMNLDIATLKPVIASIQTVRFVASIEPQNNFYAKKKIEVYLRHSQTKTSAADINGMSNQDKNYLLTRLFNSRTAMEDIAEEEFDEADKQQNIMLIRNITKEIGKILQLSLRYKVSRKVYKTIRFVNKVIEIYKQQIQRQPEDINLRIQFAQYAASHDQYRMAVQTLQQAFQIVSDYNTLLTVKDLILKIKADEKEEDRDINSYTSQLFNQNFYDKFDQDLEDQIINVHNLFTS